MLVHLMCPETKKWIMVGKLLCRNSDAEPVFWRAGLSDEQLGRKVMGFLADHIGREIRVMDEHAVDRMEDQSEYKRVDEEYGDPLL